MFQDKAMSKTELKDDFVEFCYDTCIGMSDERPVTQESIETTFKVFVAELFNQGDITKSQCTEWSREGSGFTVESLTRRINETDEQRQDRLYQRVYRKSHPVLRHMTR